MTPFDFRYTVPFQAESAISAYSVMEGNGTTTTGGIVVIKARVYQAGAPPKVILINGPCDIVSGKHGTASMGFVPTPILASGNIAAGSACGPSHNSASISTGYPGFVALAAAASNKVWALRNPGPTTARATTVNSVANTANSWSCDGVVAISGLCPVVNAAATITVTPMSAGWVIDADKAGLVVYDEVAALWRPVDYPCSTA
jgi:hypothetical protein